MLRLYLLLFILGTLSGIGYTGYSYYINTQETIRILRENEIELKKAVEDQEDAIESLQANYDSMVEENNRINEAYADIRRQNSRLSSKLANMDLGLIAAEKPDSIERAVNRGTVNAGRCFEILSGSLLTEEEINAENAESFNKECPWLWPGPPTDVVRDDEPTPAGDNSQQ